jgi:hypothetical protein
MPKISVVCPTMRLGGIDVLCHGLFQQTFRDFELVLVDGLFKRRSDIFKEKLPPGVNFTFKHLEPRDNPFPINSFCRYSNTALLHVDCEIVLFITDYTWLPPYALANHVAFHTYPPWPNAGLMSPHDYVGLPPLSPIFPTYGREDIDTYVNDLDSGKLDPLMYSIFDGGFSGINKLGADPNIDRSGARDLKLDYNRGPIDSTWFHGKNESCQLKSVLDINGWDEDLDGSHGWQDTDLADRLSKTAGVSWYVDPAVVAYIVNPRYIFPHGKRIKDNQTSEIELMKTNNYINEQIWLSKRSHGYPPVNDYNLKETRLSLGRK